MSAIPTRRRGPLTLLLDLFSSVWLGIFLIFLLFVYASIGSSGLPIGPGVLEWPSILRPDAWVSVREAFELSEFRWFHWWPFDVLIGLICLNITVVTLRRIPFNAVNLGVWMIHTGILVLAAGSLWYFGTKVEGDAPVARRRVVAQVAGAEPVSFTATPRNRAAVGPGPDAYQLSIQSITPDWELLSGDDKGTRTYKVSVLVQGPERMFIRELLAGFPQYTEDLVRSDDPAQPFARAKKVLGTPLVDETLSLALEYEPQDWFYLMESAAIYLREVGSTEWVERPIRKLPRFKDHVSSYDLVWQAPGDGLPPLRPVDVEVPPVEAGDPLPDVTFRITDYLRYANMTTERVPGGDRLDPAVSFRIDAETGGAQQFQLLAFDPRNNSLGGGMIEFHWAGTPEQFEQHKLVEPATLKIKLAREGVEIDAPILDVGDDVPYVAIEGTDYEYRVRGVQDKLAIEGRTVSVAIVDIRRGDEEFVRWVFDDPALTRDLPADGAAGGHPMSEVHDDNVVTTYAPGRAAGLRIIGGPEENMLRVLIPLPDGSMGSRRVALDEPIPLQQGFTMTVTQFAARSRSESRPTIVPLAQRDRDVGVQASMVRLHVPTGRSVESTWLPYHLYPFPRAQDTLLRFRYAPTTVIMDDGRRVEMVFSRERMKLPAPVVLDDFRLKTHIGGYSGQSTSVRDWTSIIRFVDDGTLTSPVAVSVNDPQEHDGFWFFQSQWDPPIDPRGPNDRGSAGLNYTVLGVGNREGVLMQLAGCCLAVIGMIYAFYVKPTIKRRRQEAVYEKLAASGATADASKAAAAAPVGAMSQESA